METKNGGAKNRVPDPRRCATSRPVQPARVIRNLALIGFMGTGKSTIGRLVAARLQFSVRDTDAWIEERAGRSIARLFAEEGEAAFRAREREVVTALAGCDRTVIATGGGLAADADNLASLKSHALVVCLWASADTIWGRVRHQAHRPLLRGPEPLARIRELLAQREPFYRQADVLVNTERRPVHEIAEYVATQFRLATRPVPSP